MPENGFPADREDFERWYQDPLKRRCLELVDRIFNEKTFREGGLAELAKYYHPDLISSDPSHGDMKPGLPPVLNLLQMLETAFPGYRYHIKAMLREGQSVAIRWQVRGVHRGPFLGFKPREPKNFLLEGMAFCHFEDGLIRRIEQLYDNMGLFDCLGIPNQAAMALVAEAVPEMAPLREDLAARRTSFKLADHLKTEEGAEEE